MNGPDARMQSRISVVVPAYNEAGNVGMFVERAVPVLEKITGDFEIVFALDPSPDETEQVIRALHARDPRVKLLKFSRRIGQPSATLAGLRHSSGSAVIVMDADLQDPPELIPAMVEKWREGYDVVLARRTRRAGETLTKRLVARIGYGLMAGLAEIPPDTGDFRLLSRRAVDAIMAYPEAHGYLRGLTALVGFRQTSLPFERPARFAGQGQYNRFLGSVRIGVNGFVCFSNLPLALSSVLGFVAVIAALVSGGGCVLLRLLGVSFPVGTAAILVAILFIGGIQLITVGILGAYVGRIYDEVKRRPRYLVEDSLGFGHTTDPR